MENKLNYTQNGDYLFPNLTLSETETKPLGKYGRMMKKYLQENRPVLWNSMILSETLYPHLREIDETANRKLEQMMPELMKQNGVTEELKASDPMMWTDLMNNLKHQAEEVILEELIHQLSEQLTLFDAGLFPTEQEQIAVIDEAESVKPAPFAFSFAQSDIDDVLRLASNSEHTRMNVAASFQKRKPME